MYSIKDNEIEFEWDENKAVSNVKKHGVSFQEAATAFSDDYGILFDDPDHSADEHRELLIGLSSQLKLLIVCSCSRNNDMTIRIISARKATQAEQETYLEYNGMVTK